MNDVLVIGGGLAGVEAAWALANNGISVTIAEMKPEKRSPAHKSDMLAELVCSNSLKAMRLDSAAGQGTEACFCGRTSQGRNGAARLCLCGMCKKMQRSRRRCARS